MTFGQKIGYGALMSLCYGVGVWPHRMIYGIFVPLLYGLLYQVLGYRKRVVRENLAHSFPEKSETERREIEQRFYRHLAEVFVDTLLLPTLSERSIRQRMVYSNIEQVEQAMQTQNWISAMSHFGSWELTINYALFTDHRVLAVYRPLHSAIFEHFYKRARSRFGTQPVAMNDVLTETLKARRRGARKVVVALIADQTPPWHEIKHWYRFLNQDTPFFSGIEKMSSQLRMPVYFMYIRKVKPHCYTGEFKQLYDGVEAVAPHEITERYIAMLEQMIRETPELWLWSHRRWKHKKPVDYDRNRI